MTNIACGMEISMRKKVLYCEDSIEGIFTAIYTAYECKYNHNDTIMRTCVDDNLEFFTEYINITSDDVKTLKVARTLIREFGEHCYIIICQCIASRNNNKADNVYHMIVKGLSMKNKLNLINDLSDNYVNNVFKMAREVNNEILHLKGFLRFQELNGDILFSKIGPKNNIITFIAPHFADRLPNENFIIYDEIRNLCVVHPEYQEWIIVSGDFLSDKELEISSYEELYSNLYKKFCQSIAIKERTNIKLQTQMLPLRFQKYMTEFI